MQNWQISLAEKKTPLNYRILKPNLNSRNIIVDAIRLYRQQITIYRLKPIDGEMLIEKIGNVIYVIDKIKKINVRENGRGNQEWTIQRHWQHWVHKTQDEDKQNKKTPDRKLKR